jgi:3-mercaptopyruvate sulfurtransferase SseA
MEAAQFRAFFGHVRATLENEDEGKVALVDVRSPKEFTEEVLAPPEYPTEHAQRGGHIPLAKEPGVKLSMTMMAHSNHLTN